MLRATQNGVRLLSRRRGRPPGHLACVAKLGHLSVSKVDLLQHSCGSETFVEQQQRGRSACTEPMDAFAASPLVQRELAIFRSSCECTRRIEHRRASLHKSLRRVIVFDLRFGWWGIGNSLIRWLNLLQCGLALNRASFLWMRDEQAPAHGNGSSIKQTRQLFDMGQYYSSVSGVSWQWSTRAEARVRAAHGPGAHPVMFKYHLSPDESFWLHRENASDHHAHHDGIHGTRREEKDGKLLAWLAMRREPWILVDLRPRWQTGFEPSRRFAGAMLSGQIGNGTEWGGGWDAVCGPRSGLGPVSDQLSKERWRTTGTNWSLRTRGGVSSAAWPSSALTSRISSRCEAFALLRPRRQLQKHIVPILKRMDDAQHVIGMHMRTGLADWQALAHRGAAAWEQAAAAAASSPLPFEKHWSLFEEMLRDCSHVMDAAVRGSDDTNELKRVRKGVAHPACFEWPANRAPTLHDGQKCGTMPVGIGLGIFRAPSNGTLSGAFGCARAFATRSLANSSSPWGVLVLGDSPGLITLAAMHPQLGPSRVIDTVAAGTLGHTAFDAACNRGACTARGTNVQDPSGAWTRAMTDFFVAGLCDGFVSVLFSSFVGAALQRSLICCSSGRRHFHAHSSPLGSNRDHPQLNATFLRVLM